MHTETAQQDLYQGRKEAPVIQRERRSGGQVPLVTLGGAGMFGS